MWMWFNRYGNFVSKLLLGVCYCFISSKCTIFFPDRFKSTLIENSEAVFFFSIMLYLYVCTCICTEVGQGQLVVVGSLHHVNSNDQTWVVSLLAKSFILPLRHDSFCFMCMYVCTTCIPGAYGGQGSPWTRVTSLRATAWVLGNPGPL